MTVILQSRTTVLLALTLTSAAIVACPKASAQATPSPSGATVAPGRFINVDQAQLVNPPSIVPTAIGFQRVISVPFRPTMGDAAYKAAKLAAAGSQAGKSAVSASHISPAIAASVAKFTGLDEHGSADMGNTWDRPNCSSAIGATQYVEATQSAVAIYSRAGARQKLTTLSALFGYTKEPLYDPMVKYDNLWNRWIITATSQPESSTVQYLHMAFSETNSAKGPFWIWNVNMTPVDYPGETRDDQKIGLTQDAVLFSANVFNGRTFVGSSIMAVPKARLYNGLSWGTYTFDGLGGGGTVTLPTVTDWNPNAYLLVNEPGTSNVGVYTLSYASTMYWVTLNGPIQANLGSVYNVPPAAGQPNTLYTLDTSDTRFSNTVQLNGVVYAVNCIQLGVYPCVQLVEINGASGTVLLRQNLYLSSTSCDFNPSLALDDAGDIGVQWNATDPTAGSNVMICVNGAKAGQALPGPGAVEVLGSTKAFGWGDILQPWDGYSTLQVDPIEDATFWGVNELTESPTTWKTENLHFVAQ